MKNIKLNAIAIVALLCFGFGSANATTSSLTLTPNGPNWDAIFGNVVTGFFNDTYTFTAPTNNGGGGSVISGFEQFGPDVFINTFDLIDVTGVPTIVAVGQVPVPFFLDIVSFSPLISGNSYELHVTGGLLPNGQGSGSYAGNLHITAVPEPETYAMLLAGLGLIGFSIRRRKVA